MSLSAGSGATISNSISSSSCSGTATGARSNSPLTDLAGTLPCMPCFQTGWLGSRNPVRASSLSWADVRGPSRLPSMTQNQSAGMTLSSPGLDALGNLFPSSIKGPRGDGNEESTLMVAVDDLLGQFLEDAPAGRRWQDVQAGAGPQGELRRLAPGCLDGAALHQQRQQRLALVVARSR